MELLNNIHKVEAPGYLKTRIEGALQNAKILVPKKLIFLYATVLLVFIVFQFTDLNNNSEHNDIENYATSLGINTNTYSFYE